MVIWSCHGDVELPWGHGAAAVAWSCHGDTELSWGHGAAGGTQSCCSMGGRGGCGQSSPSGQATDHPGARGPSRGPTVALGVTMSSGGLPCCHLSRSCRSCCRSSSSTCKQPANGKRSPETCSPGAARAADGSLSLVIVFMRLREFFTATIPSH